MTYLQRFLFLSLFAFYSASSLAQNQDIFILPLFEKDGNTAISAIPFHLTFREGYDNQPKFSQSGDSIYFTRMQSAKNSKQQQTDIYRFSFKDQVLTNITSTEDHSEYSATPYSDGFISIIGVNPQGQQHLRKVNIETSEQASWREDIEPVGYHAWLNKEKAAVFVLGDVMTLQILDTKSTAEPTVLAENIGRCLQSVGEGKVSFTVQENGLHHVNTLSSDGSIESSGIILPEGVQDYIWLDDKSVLVGNGTKLQRIEAGSSSTIVDLESLNVLDITRLAISPDKKKIAVVYSRP